MPKFLVTNGSHFQPFTYDEMIKPLADMAEAQNKTQDIYDTISMETAALGSYISENPEDSDARALYKNYMDKLTSLQNNLWNYGYTAQTRQDLSAAKTGYANDMTRLKNAVERRQEESKAYWDARHNNPDLVTGRDPGSYGLNSYLRDSNFGRNWYSYNGKEFEARVAAEMQARGQEMLRSKVIKDPDLVDQLTRILEHGVTNADIQQASPLVDALLNVSDKDRQAYYDRNKTAPHVQLLVETLLNRYDAIGARGAELSPSERQRLVDYGKAGWAHGIGKPEVKDFKDAVYDEQREARSDYRQHALSKSLAKYKYDLEHPEQTTQQNSGQFTLSNPTDTYEVTEKNHDAKMKEAESFAGKDIGYDLFTPDGRSIRNKAQASEEVYSGELARKMYTLLGFDFRRDPTRGIFGTDVTPSSRFLSGKAVHGGQEFETRLNPYKQDPVTGRNGVVEMRAVGSNDDYSASPTLTSAYHTALDKYNAKLNEYKTAKTGTKKQIYDIAKITPDVQYKQYKKDDIGFETPLTDYESAVLGKEGNRVRNQTDTYIAEQGTDSGKYIDRLMGKFSMNFNIAQDKDEKYIGVLSLNGRPYDRRLHKGQVTGIHYSEPFGELSMEAADPSEVFSFDSNGRINNVSAIKVSKEGIGDRYLLVKTNKSDRYVSVPIEYFNDDALEGLFDAAQVDLYNILSNTVLSQNAKMSNILRLQDILSTEIKSTVGYIENTQSPGGTNKDDNN